MDLSISLRMSKILREYENIGIVLAAMKSGQLLESDTGLVLFLVSLSPRYEFPYIFPLTHYALCYFHSLSYTTLLCCKSEILDE